MKALLGALANSARLQLLEFLRSGEKNVTELVRGTGLGQSLVSHYLKILVKAGLVSSRTVGAFRIYALSQRTAVPLLRQIEMFSQTTSNTAKAQLAEMRARYDQLVETSPFATLLFRDGRIVFANAAAVTMLGAKTPSDILGLTVMAFVPRKFRQIAINYRKTLRRGEPMPLLEIRVKRLDGSEFDAEVLGAPIPVGDDYEIQLIVCDITERRAMESQVHESEARLRLIMAQTPAYVIVTDRKLRCTYVNKIAKGANRADIIGRNVVDFAVSENRQRVRMALNKVLKTGEPQQILARGFGRSSGVCWYDIRIGALKNHGQVTELVIIATDVTKFDPTPWYN